MTRRALEILVGVTAASESGKTEMMEGRATNIGSTVGGAELGISYNVDTAEDVV